MKRRELLGILGIAALSRPAAVWAQPSKKPRIGYLMDRSGPGPLEDGGPIAYGPCLSEVFRQCTRQVAKLLRGDPSRTSALFWILQADCILFLTPAQSRSDGL
jgi:hypothetical protein